MKQAQTQIEVMTRGQDLYEITREVADWLATQDTEAGLLTLSGGVMLLIEYANGLASRGHAVTLVAPGGSIDPAWRET